MIQNKPDFGLRQTNLVPRGGYVTLKLLESTSLGGPNVSGQFYFNRNLLDPQDDPITPLCTLLPATVWSTGVHR